jgi:gluconate 2-dehydrogenase gamma chain
MHQHQQGISRRAFLNRITLLASLAACFPVATLAQRRDAAAVAGHPVWRDQEPWRTLAAVQEHLFPAGPDVPGASDIGAIVYLHNSLENPAADAEDRQFIFNGVGWLNDLVREQDRQPFTALDEPQREAVLRDIERSRAGRNWLSLLLTYLLEALLADPVYGGNRDRIGWEWLEHQPGYPTPPPHKTWYRLGKPVHFQRKA